MSDAAITFLGRILLIPIAIAVIVLSIYRVQQDKRYISKRALTLLAVSCVLMIISIISSIPKPVTWQTNLFRTVSLNYSVLLGCIVIEHIVKNKVFIPIFTNRIFLLTTIVTAFVLAVDTLRLDNLGMIIDNDWIQVDLIYAASYISNYSLFTVISLLTAVSAFKNIDPDKPITYRIRRISIAIAFGVVALCCVSVITNVIFAFNGDVSKRDLLNKIYHYGKWIYAPLLLLSMIIPESVLQKLTSLLSKREADRRRVNQQNIAYLYERVIKIAPCVQLKYGQLYFEDMLIEIADARLLIWTNIYPQRSKLNEPKTEANIIHKLLKEGKTFSEAGSIQIPPLPQNELKYNIDVAKHLRNLEKTS